MLLPKSIFICIVMLVSCSCAAVLRVQNDPVQTILTYILQGKGKGRSYDHLATFVDKFGSRKVGTQNLEDAIDYVVKELTDDGFAVHTEEFDIQQWNRGKEEAQLLSPRSKNLAILGLGSSIGTGPEGITADVVVVESFDELKALGKEKIQGKIVVFNPSWVSYSDTVQYRSHGATEAARLGAVAALVRSVTPFSVNSPHTGWQDYETGVTQIPSASLTVEDAELLHRMYKRGWPIKIKLMMEDGLGKTVKSRNIIADLKGSVKPDEFVVVCGHIDSWDVGQGAMDDGGGIFTAWEALRTMKSLGLTPQRTIRLIMFAGEEFGIVGGQAYFVKHKDEIKNQVSYALESDGGTFYPQGVTFAGSAKGKNTLQGILNRLTEAIGTMTIDDSVDGPDITQWNSVGVPVGNLVTRRTDKLLNVTSYYFIFHHSEGDTMTVQNADEMDKCVALFTVVAYEVANLKNKLNEGEGDNKVSKITDPEWQKHYASLFYFYQKISKNGKPNQIKYSELLNKLKSYQKNELH